MKKFAFLFVLLSLAAALLTACGGSAGSCGSSSRSGSSSGSTPAVHMCGNNFVQSSITISKGQSLTLVDDASAPHSIANGSWVNGSAQPKQEPMARICVKFRLPFLSESSRKLFGREPLETQLLNPMALFLNLLAHFSRTWACFS